MARKKKEAPPSPREAAHQFIQVTRICKYLETYEVECLTAHGGLARAKRLIFDTNLEPISREPIQKGRVQFSRMLPKPTTKR